MVHIKKILKKNNVTIFIQISHQASFPPPAPKNTAGRMRKGDQARPA